jgi:hypothetical protein
MILDTTKTTPAVAAPAETGTIDGITGDTSELIEMTADLLAEQQNLTIALARHEYKCLTESASRETLNEGIGEFFKRIGEKLVELWKKFKAWVISIFNKIRDAIFGPRRDWLKENAKAVAEFTDFGNLEVKLGDKLKDAKLDALQKQMNKMESHVTAGGKGYAEADGKLEDFKKTFWAEITPGRKDSESVSSWLTKEMLGEKEGTVPMDHALVEKLLTVAEQTYKNLDILPHSSKMADAVIAKVTEKVKMGQAALAKDDEAGQKAAKRNLDAISAMGAMTHTYVAAVIDVNNKANSQAMGALVKALSAGKAAKAKAEKESKAAEKQNASASVLDAFIG